MISESSPGSLMNRKGEWGQNLPQKFGISGCYDGSYFLKRKYRDELETDRQKDRAESNGRLAKRVRSEKLPPIASPGHKQYNQVLKESCQGSPNQSPKPIQDPKLIPSKTQQ